MKTLLILTIFVIFTLASKYRQERSQIIYSNPKYISHASAFTSRKRRGEPYRTNFSMTTMHDWVNNVTMKLFYNMQQNKIDFSIKIKGCDLFKHKWFADLAHTFSNMKKCPIKAGKYEFNQVELGSRFLPLPLPSGVNIVTLVMCITDTEERIIETNVIMHVK